MIGRRVGRLVIVSLAGKNKWRAKTFLCRCDCGTEKVVREEDLKKSKVRSCGCLQRDLLGEKTRTHGMTQSPEYLTWGRMIQRCINSKLEKWECYGGRGIKVCDRWMNSFENFYADMGNKPFKGAEIDRIDNDKGYEPGNCKWSSRRENMLNRRTTLYLTFNGVKKPLVDWALEMGINPHTLAGRKRNGWDDARILETPIRKLRYKGLTK